MSKTIADEEYERLTQRDKQVDEYIDQFNCTSGTWGETFKETAKPKQYRPTLDELVVVYADTANLDARSLRLSGCCKQGLKAVINKVYQGMQDEYDNQGQDTMLIVADRHREAYKEE